MAQQQPNILENNTQNNTQNNTYIQPTYEKFQGERSRDPTFTVGGNKSKRLWKKDIKSVPARVNAHISKETWEEKKQKAEKMKVLRKGIKEWKEKKIQKRKEMRETRKIRAKQRQYNEVKSGQFEVIKNSKNIKKWSKKMKAHLVKLPAQMFEDLLRK